MSTVNFELTKEVFWIDAPAVCREIQEFIRSRVEGAHRHGVVVALSGGLDSSVVAALCAASLGKERVTGLCLPERWGNPEALRYGRIIASRLGISARRIGISPVLRAMNASDFLFALTGGREFWRKTVNRYMEKTGHSIGGDFEQFLLGTLDASGCRKVALLNAK